jgi:hypothetical protein
MQRNLPSMTATDYARPLPVASMHVQTAPLGVPQRLPFGTGQLEVLRIQRSHTGKERTKGNGAEHASKDAIILLDGVPASSHSTAREGLFVFVDEGTEPPLARVDPERRLITVYYPISEYERITQLLRAGSRRLCYCWRSADNTRSVVMLMAMG